MLRADSSEIFPRPNIFFFFVILLNCTPEKCSDTHTGLAALCKALACFPGPAQGSANPPCVSQIPSVFVRQQRGHLLMTFHVFTRVLLEGWGWGRGGGEAAWE